ncbi:unnamed protein product [Trichogramma brassicae]|uniref:Uncharacterized protein n=1 Tax=Trichogramma brassicae TaxID=86971 RepID=A0A6H5IIU1_9HYME|nr:unnamed protein product [Trichogramma brassicae]
MSQISCTLSSRDSFWSGGRDSSMSRTRPQEEHHRTKTAPDMSPLWPVSTSQSSSGIYPVVAK